MGFVKLLSMKMPLQIGVHQQFPALLVGTLAMCGPGRIEHFSGGIETVAADQQGCQIVECAESIGS